MKDKEPISRSNGGIRQPEGAPCQVLRVVPSGHFEFFRLAGLRANETAAETSAKANNKAREKSADARRDAASAKRDANYAVAKEKCDAFSGDVKSDCMNDAKARFAKS